MSDKERKETKAPKAPVKQDKKPKKIKKAVVKPMVHIDEFLDLTTDLYELGSMEKAGFKAYMTGKHYLSDMNAFVPYLEKYQGK